MAGNMIVIGSKFKPFSYDEMIKPIQVADAEHKALEGEMGELSTRAGVFEKLANEQTDPEAYAMYKQYSTDLASQVESLAKSGLTPDSRTALSKMRQRYSQEITPIEQAYKRRGELADEQRKALEKDPTLLMSQAVGTLSLDDFIKNPTLSYQSYSGNLLTQQASQQAAALAKFQQEQPRQFRKVMGGQYWETQEKKGYTPEQILLAAANDPKAPAELRKIANDVYTASGIDAWGDATVKQRAREAIGRGLYSAMETVEYKNLKNEDYLNPLQAAQLRGIQQPPSTNKLAINPLNIYSNKELTESANNIKEYSKYFRKGTDGNMYLTHEGIAEYRRNNNQRVTTAGSGGGTARLMNAETQGGNRPFVPTKFKEFVDSMGLTQEQKDKPNLYTIGKLWNEYSTKHSPELYDASKVTEYDYTIKTSEQKGWKNAILAASRGTALKGVDYDNKTKSFTNTGEDLKIEDLNNDKYEIVSTRFSPYGSTVMIKDDKGKIGRYKLPAGINTTNEQNRDKSMIAAQQWQSMLTTGQYVDRNGNLKKASPEELQYAQQKYEESLQSSYLYHSQLGLQNTIEPQEYKPYGY